MTKNSAVADKLHNTLMEMQWCGRPPKRMPFLCVTMPNLVVLC